MGRLYVHWYLFWLYKDHFNSFDLKSKFANKREIIDIVDTTHQIKFCVFLTIFPLYNEVL